MSASGPAPASPSPPPPIPRGHIANFKTLQRAFSKGDVALVSARRATPTRDPVVLLCAIQRNPDGSLSLVPLAEMVSDDPFSLYEDPTA